MWSGPLSQHLARSEFSVATLRGVLRDASGVLDTESQMGETHDDNGAYSLTSNMVTAWSPPPAANGSLFVTALPFAAQRYPLPLLVPREGRTSVFVRWEQGVRDLCVALGLDPATFGAPPAGVVQSAVAVPLSAKDLSALASALTEWQRANTALFWHVRASLNLDGTRFVSDTRTISRWVGQSLAHGQALVMWVRAFSDDTGEDAQQRLLDLLRSAKLAAGSHCGQLELHSRSMYELWLRVAGNDASRPFGFWQALTMSLPAQPASSVLSMLRIHCSSILDDLKGGGALLYVDVDQSGIDQLLRRAKTYGLPDAPNGWQPPASNTPLLAYLGGRGGGGGAGGGGRKDRLTLKNNDCSFCDAFICKANQKGGKKFCVCIHTSTFDVSKASPGTKRFIVMARDYHRAHPDVATLKGIKWKMPSSDKPTTPPGGAPAVAAIDSSLENLTPDDAGDFDEWLAERGASADGVSMIAHGPCLYGGIDCSAAFISSPIDDDTRVLCMPPIGFDLDQMLAARNVIGTALWLAGTAPRVEYDGSLDAADEDEPDERGMLRVRGAGPTPPLVRLVSAVTIQSVWRARRIRRIWQPYMAAMRSASTAVTSPALQTGYARALDELADQKLMRRVMRESLAETPMDVRVAFQHEREAHVRSIEDMTTLKPCDASGWVIADTDAAIAASLSNTGNHSIDLADVTWLDALDSLAYEPTLSAVMTGEYLVEGDLVLDSEDECDSVAGTCDAASSVDLTSSSDCGDDSSDSDDLVLESNGESTGVLRVRGSGAPSELHGASSVVLLATGDDADSDDLVLESNDEHAGVLRVRGSGDTDVVLSTGERLRPPPRFSAPWDCGPASRTCVLHALELLRSDWSCWNHAQVRVFIDTIAEHEGWQLSTDDYRCVRAVLHYLAKPSRYVREEAIYSEFGISPSAYHTRKTSIQLLLADASSGERVQPIVAMISAAEAQADDETEGDDAHVETADDSVSDALGGAIGGGSRDVLLSAITRAQTGSGGSSVDNGSQTSGDVPGTVHKTPVRTDTSAAPAEMALIPASTLVLGAPQTANERVARSHVAPRQLFADSTERGSSSRAKPTVAGHAAKAMSHMANAWMLSEGEHAVKATSVLSSLGTKLNLALGMLIAYGTTVPPRVWLMAAAVGRFALPHLGPVLARGLGFVLRVVSSRVAAFVSGQAATLPLKLRRLVALVLTMALARICPPGPTAALASGDDSTVSADSVGVSPSIMMIGSGGGSSGDGTRKRASTTAAEALDASPDSRIDAVAIEPLVRECVSSVLMRPDVVLRLPIFAELLGHLGVKRVQQGSYGPLCAALAHVANPAEYVTQLQAATRYGVVLRSVELRLRSMAPIHDLIRRIVTEADDARAAAAAARERVTDSPERRTVGDPAPRAHVQLLPTGDPDQPVSLRVSVGAMIAAIDAGTCARKRTCLNRGHDLSSSARGGVFDQWPRMLFDDDENEVVCLAHTLDARGLLSDRWPARGNMLLDDDEIDEILSEICLTDVVNEEMLDSLAATDAEMAELLECSPYADPLLMPVHWGNGIGCVAERGAGDIGSSQPLAALSDNGASLGANCSKTLAGAVLSTHSLDGTGNLNVANSGGLACDGCHVHIYRRYGRSGNEVVARRMKHTPNLHVDIVFSEAEECYTHGYKIDMDRASGRTYQATPGSSVIKLWMSANRTGWFKVVPVDDPDEQQAALRDMGCPVGEECLLMPLGDGSGKTVGMGKPPPLSGVPLLRYQHAVLGHVSLRKMLRTMQAAGVSADRVTADDVKQFVREGCGVCESAKMKRRAFTLRTIEDKTVPLPGKKWQSDALTLRVPSAHYGWLYIQAFVCCCSNKVVCYGLLGQTTAEIAMAHDQLRAFVRPTHGEIFIISMDSHASHKARDMACYMAAEQTRLRLGPPQVHEASNRIEVAFMHNVPTSNALLLACVDLEEPHFFAAFLYAITAAADTIIADSDPPRTPNMVYEQRNEWRPNPLYPFGSAAKALVHREVRDGKFEPHSVPCVYTGPAHRSDSRVHCSVWNGSDEYRDVDLGCISVDHTMVIRTSLRNDPAHQPFGQPPGAQREPFVARFDWSAAPADEFAPDAVSPLPALRDDLYLWTVSFEMDPSKPFVIDLCSGPARDGDVAGWLTELARDSSRPDLMGLAVIRIDIAVGGYEHDILRLDVLGGLVELAASANCKGVVTAGPCSYWSVALFRWLETGGQGSQPMFLQPDACDGIDTTDPELRMSIAKAMGLSRAQAKIARACLEHNGSLIAEHPVGRGLGSPFMIASLEQHSTLYNTSPWVELIADFSLCDVYTDRGVTGAETRKTTHLVCSSSVVPYARQLLGVLRVTPDFVQRSAAERTGMKDDGQYRTRDMEAFSPRFAELIARSLFLSLPVAEEGGGDSSASAANAKMANANARSTADGADTQHDPFDFEIGATVEVYWPPEKQWYRGQVASKRKSRVTVAKRKVEVDEYKIVYEHGDAHGNVRWHSRHNNTMRHVCDPVSPTISALLNDDSDLNSDDDPEREIIVTRDFHIDLEDGTVLNKWTVYSVQDEKVEAIASTLTVNAKHWHCPTNEREFYRSPQKALWQTAKELKWSEYLELLMFDWVLVSHIDRSKYKIHDTLWAYKIKLNSDLTFNKLNPRWCFKGGSMDRGVYKSFTETMRISTFRIILAVKAGHYAVMCVFLLDCSNAFQATRTDNDPDAPLLFCWPAPGFERRDERTGERFACKLNVGMQGRIDATRIFNDRLHSILGKAECLRSLWDPQLNIYHNGPLKGTDASLTEVLDAIGVATDSEPQQPPIGYALMGWHVDDSTGVARDVPGCLDPKKNRIVAFIDGIIQVTYATSLTGWHGHKSLGFTLHCDDKTGRVSMSAPDALSQMADALLGDDVRIKPKHIMAADLDEIMPDVVPPVGDPARDATLARQQLTRKHLGAAIWLSIAYPQLVTPINRLCKNMHCPSAATLAGLKFAVMHLVAHPHCASWCTNGHVGLEQPETLVEMTLDMRPPYYWHFFSDASNGLRSITGGLGMLAGGPVTAVHQAQHLAAPCSHTAEVVAAGVNVNLSVVPVNGILQEIRIRLGNPTPFYLDSSTTVFVAQHDSAVKKSVWLIRRVAVITECVNMGEVKPIHINDPLMVADAFTKYLTFPVWVRHMRYMLNLAPDVDW